MASKAVKQINSGNGKYLVFFVADFEEDIASLSTEHAVGSEAICLADSNKYILSPAKVWTVV